MALFLKSSTSRLASNRSCSSLEIFCVFCIHAWSETSSARFIETIEDSYFTRDWCWICQENTPQVRHHTTSTNTPGAHMQCMGCGLLT